MFFSYFKFNYINVQGEPNHVWAVGVKGKVIKNDPHPWDFRNRRYMAMRLMANNMLPSDHLYCQQAGWHFSYIGDNDSIRNKIKSFSHQEFCKTSGM